jgi:lauroyl/myristoyl acyltransferase
VAQLRDLIFRASRSLGKRLPLPVLAGILWPFAFARGLFDSVAQRSRRPPSALPPDSRRASFGSGLRERTSAWLSTAGLLWSDRFAQQPWRERIDVGQLDVLRAVAERGPVVLVTLHFGGIFVIPAVLRANGLPTAAVVGDKLWPVRWWRNRRAELTRIDDLPVHLRSGDARAIVRYLTTGRCLLVALDYPLGAQSNVTFAGSSIRLSTPAFRLARMCRATVVPVLMRADSVWRYSLRVGRPVPADLIDAQDDEAALAHVVNELLPIAADRPEQALPLLVNAFEVRP